VSPTEQADPKGLVTGRGIPVFMPLGWRQSALSICLGVFILCALGDAFAHWQYVALSQLTPGPEFQQQALAADRLVALTSMLRLVSLLVCAVFWSIWVYRSYGNAAAITGSPPTYSQGWAVGSHFVPIISLVMPYQIMAESWRRSLGGDARSRRTASALPVTAWWSAWLLLAVYGVVLRIQGSPKSLSELGTHGSMAAGSGLLAAVVGALAWIVITGVYQRQTAATSARASAIA
jgi:hypothetical protein